MFGSNWGSQQPAQPGGSAFGQTGGFGQTGAFGQTPGTFGQQQQQPQQPQQQPTANPMFGGFGTNPSTTQTTGFGTTGGTFGQTPSNTASVFGAPKPATGFGATGAFGSTGFGSTAGTSTTGAFGQPSTSTTGTFGNTGIFGNKPAFGTTGQFDTGGAITTGTSNPAYAAFNEKDSTNANLTLAYQSITCMQAYRGYSFEDCETSVPSSSLGKPPLLSSLTHPLDPPQELRFQDYQQNRKTAATGGFGTGAFGSTTQPTTTGGLFGQTQPTSQPAQSAFGSGTATFGSTGTTTGTGFGGFGQQQPQQQQQSQPPQQQPASGFGGFGQTQPQQSTGFGSGGFGNTQPQQQTSGLFGTPTFGQKPATTGFGTTTTGTGAFGTGTGAFGQTQPQTTAFGTAPQQPQSSTFGSGGFGTNTNKSLFGQPTTGAFGTTNPGTGGGIFGQQPQQQPAQPTTGLFGTTTGTTGTGLFGQQQQPQQTAGLFGNTQQQQPQPQTSSLFGGQTTGLFGTTQQNQPGQQNPLGGGLFGQKPTTPGTGLFGSSTTTTTPAQTGSLFGGGTIGQPQNQQATTGFGGSLFGKLGTTNGTGTQPSTLFGSTNQNPSLFGVNTTNSTAQGTLTATIDQPVNTNIPIFSLLPSGPQLNALDSSLAKKKAEFFVDVPTRSSIPVVSRGTAPVNSKIRGAGRGFTSSTYLGASTNNLGSSLSFSSSKSNALSLNKSSTQRGNLTADSFSSPSFGSGNRDSVKKLVMDKKIDVFDWVPKSDVTFNPALSVAAREKDAINGPLGAARNTPTTPIINPPSRTQARTPSRFTAQSITDGTDEHSDDLKEGEYWSEPPMTALSSWGHKELIAIEKLVVGRVGYGKITFLDPVDLTGSGSVKQLFGDLVRFEDKECSVYPDLDNVDKPPPGSGLNVRARVELDGCWPIDKATREPIKDENNQQMVKHLKRLRGMKDTKFESFDMKDGQWSFSVEHF